MAERQKYKVEKILQDVDGGDEVKKITLELVKVAGTEGDETIELIQVAADPILKVNIVNPSDESLAVELASEIYIDFTPVSS